MFVFLLQFTEDVTQTDKNTNKPQSDGKLILLNLYMIT